MPSFYSDQMPIATVPENEPSAEWEADIGNEGDSLGINSGGDQYAVSPTNRRQLPRLPVKFYSFIIFRNH